MPLGSLWKDNNLFGSSLALCSASLPLDCSCVLLPVQPWRLRACISSGSARYSPVHATQFCLFFFVLKSYLPHCLLAFVVDAGTRCSDQYYERPFFLILQDLDLNKFHSFAKGHFGDVAQSCAHQSRGTHRIQES